LIDDSPNDFEHKIEFNLSKSIPESYDLMLVGDIGFEKSNSFFERRI